MYSKLSACSVGYWKAGRSVIRTILGNVGCEPIAQEFHLIALRYQFELEQKQLQKTEEQNLI